MPANITDIEIKDHCRIPGQDNILPLRHAVDSVRKDITVCCPLPACKTMIEIQSSRWYSGQDNILSLQPSEKI
jgi:hypothetical protein